MNKILKIILGIILLVGPFYLILPGLPLASWGKAAIDLIKGGITIIIPIIGLILILAGLSEIKN